MSRAKAFLLDRQVDPGVLWPRWIFLRCLGAIFFSAFYSLAFQIRGLIGDEGILPVTHYLPAVREAMPGIRAYWFAPSVFWATAGDRALMTVVVCGLIASTLLMLNVWPRATIGVSLLAFLSCIAVLQDFASYQSDGMLLEAGFISL